MVSLLRICGNYIMTLLSLKLFSIYGIKPLLLFTEYNYLSTGF
jgi:hypothetical protein